MPRYIDVSDWEQQHHYSTSGTRNKCVVQDPSDGSYYFFKTSLLQQGKNYPTEFWSEVIAAAVGEWLGFDLLPYHIAKTTNKIGCLSKSMTSEDEWLVEGVALLKAFDHTYQPAEKSSYQRYTFDFAISAMRHYHLEDYIGAFIKMLVFDAIIGNSDRHQENWAFIATNPADWRYSPIYDSGSSLGRELSEEVIVAKLKDPVQFAAYVARGKAELRCEKNKVRHIELLKYIYTKYPAEITTPIQQIANIYNNEQLRGIIFEIDAALPDKLKHHGISLNRKEFIFRLIDHRIQQLINTFAL